MFAAFHEAARIDPEIGFFMIFSLLQFDVVPEVAEAARDISQNELARFYEEMVAQHPEQAGGYMLRGNLKQQNGDYRSALADYRKAIPLFSSDAPFRGVASITIGGLGRIARWEEKLPAVLKREIYPGSAFELLEVAEYCAGFEQRYVLAVRFVSEALAADPNLHLLYIKVPLLAGWALKAAAGKGVDAANLNEIDHSRLRKKALAWIREALSRLDKRSQLFLANLIVNNADFAPVRDPEALAKLPPDERAEWTRFWAELPKKEKKLDVAPAPRSGEK
jgi:tetratricopeptide (TPR) repeat protein